MVKAQIHRKYYAIYFLKLCSVIKKLRVFGNQSIDNSNFLFRQLMNLARNFARNVASLGTNLSTWPRSVPEIRHANFSGVAWHELFFFKHDIYLANFLEILHRISILSVH